MSFALSKDTLKAENAKPPKIENIERLTLILQVLLKKNDCMFILLTLSILYALKKLLAEIELY